MNENDLHFFELFQPDTVERKCRICRVTFDSARLKKKAYVFVALWEADW